jgi:NAD+ synthase
MILKIEECIEDIKKQIKEFTDIAVIGLSGGADSTLVAILCTLALGKENVYGIEMPCTKEIKNIFNHRVTFLKMCLDFKNTIHDIHPTYSSIIDDGFAQGITQEQKLKLFGNIKARLRMIYLYTSCEYIANNFLNKKVRVIGTDNLSENFIGYFTKYGDGGVDINPIEELYKSEVYQLLDYFKDKGIITEECIDRVPSAGLWEGQTDEGELGMSYDEIEKSIRRLTSNELIYKDDSKNINAIKIFEMNKNTQHKREIPGHFELRQYCD